MPNNPDYNAGLGALRQIPVQRARGLLSVDYLRIIHAQYPSAPAGDLFGTVADDRNPVVVIPKKLRLFFDGGIHAMINVGIA